MVQRLKDETKGEIQIRSVHESKLNFTWITELKQELQVRQKTIHDTPPDNEKDRPDENEKSDPTKSPFSTNNNINNNKTTPAGQPIKRNILIIALPSHCLIGAFH